MFLRHEQLREIADNCLMYIVYEEKALVTTLCRSMWLDFTLLHL